MTEERKTFTVNDRRHFTADGESREPEPEPRPAAAPEPPKAQGTEAAPRKAHADAPADFSQFLLSLGAQAGFLLTQQEEPKRGEALEGARSIISILEMLKDKTEGRRTAEEERVLDGLLYELRMTYLAVAREGGT